MRLRNWGRDGMRVESELNQRVGTRGLLGTRAARTGNRHDARTKIPYAISACRAKENALRARKSHTGDISTMPRTMLRPGGVRNNPFIHYRARSLSLCSVRGDARSAACPFGRPPDAETKPVAHPLGRWTTPRSRLRGRTQREILTGSLTERTAPSLANGFRGSAYRGGAGPVSIGAAARSDSGNVSTPSAARACSGTGREGTWREL
jgi:hypothetical protein